MYICCNNLSITFIAFNPYLKGKVSKRLDFVPFLNDTLAKRASTNRRAAFNVTRWQI